MTNGVTVATVSKVVPLVWCVWCMTGITIAVRVLDVLGDVLNPIVHGGKFRHQVGLETATGAAREVDASPTAAAHPNSAQRLVKETMKRCVPQRTRMTQ